MQATTSSCNHYISVWCLSVSVGTLASGSMTNNDAITFRAKTYRAEARTDPADGKAYTWTVLANWYSNKSWSMDEITEYWNKMDLRSHGRTRTEIKEVLPEGHALVKKRKLDTANGSRWEDW